MNIKSSTWRPLLAACLCLVAAMSVRAGEAVALKYKTYRDWNIKLPAEQYRPLKGQVAFAGSCEQNFKVALEGTALAIDTDGDGQTNVTVRGKQGLATLRGKTKAGSTFRYTMRLQNAGGWKYTCGGAMVGKLAGKKLQLIDQNGNGRYDDFGKDAMIVGRGDVACFLSQVVSISGKLYQLKIAADGLSLQATAYQGPAGKLDLVSGYETQGKLMSAIVSSADQKYSFDLSRQATLVPAGKYVLSTGHVALGRNISRFGVGRSAPMVVTDGEVTKLRWGGPIDIDFVYDRRGGKVVFRPSSVWYYGSAGEQYFDWQPFGNSPEFMVKDLETGKQIVKAIFGGC